ncbi:Rrf2 family transcriptional regulator [Dyadobacter chenwenxiniae]|uniref:Rrf2 family transcriptional regulator n=1 Tax=Dyadobacter chenwenxiniae TaxID=2906456 RepID=A0A9X1TFJ6_9BACT|nr:Rrf2 family transcriptional regulator [Dyadobacter chenwenxiniae]MCF0063027.1 Rrf2 family transcriptional regulator [Dyadobacter chenwenxiniae]UON84800.1 Rrf2 family transcriptional regulator [Dyadobacter chenwenxiniae]
MNNGRFAISLHILSLLALDDEEWVPSKFLAGSININPVLVRKELGNLQAHGLVVSKEGKAGGSKLARPAETIFISDIYDAVRQNDLLGKGINVPNPKCNVGRQINNYLDELYIEAEHALRASLGEKSLADFCRNFQSEHTQH